MATYCEICGKKLNDDTAQAGTRYICLACWNGKSAPRDTENMMMKGHDALVKEFGEDYTMDDVYGGE